MYTLGNAAKLAVSLIDQPSSDCNFDEQNRQIANRSRHNVTKQIFLRLYFYFCQVESMIAFTFLSQGSAMSVPGASFRLTDCRMSILNVSLFTCQDFLINHVRFSFVWQLSFVLQIKYEKCQQQSQSVVQYRFYIQNIDQFSQTHLIKMDSQDRVQQHKAILRRADRIKRIKHSLKDFPLISKNKLMIIKRLSLQNENLSESGSNDGLSFENQDSTILTLNQHMEIFAEKYQIVSKLGQGSDGVVHRCIKKRSGGEYAVKSFMFDEQHIPQIRSNFVLVKSLKHHSIIKYEALYLDLKKHACWLVMELFQAPSLDKISISSQNQLRQIVHQLLEALHFLHQHAVTHRDIKAENILYDPKTKQLKLIDYGICRKYRRRGIKFQMLTITGTLYYRAPEMFMGGGYNEKVDIWSSGIMIYKLITGRTPFQSEYHSSTINNIMTSKVQFTSQFERYSPSLKTLITKMLEKNPKQRVSAIDCLRDTWFHLPTSSAKIILFEEDLNELYLQGIKSPMIEGIDQNSYIRKINGDEYHCFDSDDQGMRKGVGVKRIHRSVTMEVGLLSLSNFQL